MARMISNMAFNPISGFKNLGKDLGKTIQGQAPMTHAFRTHEGRQQFTQHMDAGGKASEFSYGPATWNKKRIAGAAIGGYVGMDAAYRAASGGSVYRNHTGERDMVGIPFL